RRAGDVLGRGSPSFRCHMPPNGTSCLLALHPAGWLAPPDADSRDPAPAACSRAWSSLLRATRQAGPHPGGGSGESARLGRVPWRIASTNPGNVAHRTSGLPGKRDRVVAGVAGIAKVGLEVSDRPVHPVPA